MAKNRKDLAESLLADDSGGWLTSFLADEDEFDRRALWRLGSWGVGSVGAVIIAILANQSGIGFRHEQVAAADLARQSQQLQLIAKASENETRRLASAVDTLNSDRDRLYTRVTVLEQGLDSVTGSINRKNAAQNGPPRAGFPKDTTWGSPQAAALPYPPTDKTPGSLASLAPPAVQAPPPSSAAMASAAASAATLPDASKTDTSKKPEPSESPAPPLPLVAPVASAAPAATAETIIAKSSPTKPSSAKPASAQSASAHSSPLNLSSEAATSEPLPPAMSLTPVKAEIASKPATTPPDSPATKPDEPNDVATAAPAKPDTQQKSEAKIVVAAIPAAVDVEPAAQPLPPGIPVAHTEFGVDLGSASSINGLRALWRGILKSDAKEVASLRPIIVLRERTNGLGMQLRLVAGPLNDAAAAAKICAVLSENDRNCKTSVFDGQRLAMKDDGKESNSAVTAKKPKPTHSYSRHRRSRRTARVEEPAPPPPPPPPPASKPSTISSFFSR